MKSDAPSIAEVAAALRSKAEEKLRDNVSDHKTSFTDVETRRLLHELQVHHTELEMQNEELCLARDIAESDHDKIDLLLEQNKLTELILNENKKLLSELNRALELRMCEEVSKTNKQDKMLLSQNRHAAMGEMINCIVHQWRQPLNVLGLNIQQLPLLHATSGLDKEDIDEIVVDSMQIITHMSNTMNDFRNFFMPDKETVLFDVNKVLNIAASLSRDSLKHHNIKLDITTTQEEPHIIGYSNEYSQVLLNIIMNAQDALLEHKIKEPRITVSSFMENDRSVITILDNAGGIPEQNMERIFEPYFTTKEPDKGTGIGLFMAKTIIETNMHGKLTVCNNNGGAEFRIEV